MMKTQVPTRGYQKNTHVRFSRGDKDTAAVPQALTRDEPPVDDVRTRIAERAYALYLDRGCRQGYAEQDWLDAEREIVNGTCSG